MNTYDSQSPALITAKILCPKWRIPILQLLMERPRRFGELQRALGDISKKMLAEVLKKMEIDGIITKIEYSRIPLKTEYHLTALGDSLCHLITSMDTWGREYIMTFRCLQHLQSHHSEGS